MIDQLRLRRAFATEEAFEVGGGPAGPGGHAAPDRAEYGVRAGGFLARQQSRQPAGRGGLVIVEEGDQGRVCGGQTFVAGGGDAGTGGVTPDQGHGRSGAQAVDSVTRTGLRVVVDHHDLAQAVGYASLDEQRAQGALQTVGATQGRNDDGDVGGGHARTSPTVRMSQPTF
ncbi:hypothetical protein D3C85_1081110 [compost metagenome]